MIFVPDGHQGLEIRIAPDGCLWINDAERCLFRAGIPASLDKLVVIDERKFGKTTHDAFVIFPTGGAAIIVWEDGERRDECQIDSETAAGRGGWEAALWTARDGSETGMREEIDYDNPPKQIADIVAGWEDYSAFAVEVW